MATEDAKYFSTTASESSQNESVNADATMLQRQAAQFPEQFGPLTGYAQKWTAKGQEWTSLANDLVNKMMSSAKNAGRGSVARLKVMQDSKLTPKTAPAGLQERANELRTMSQRIVNKNAFVSVARQAGFTDSNTLETLWQKYVNAMPLYNAKGYATFENLGKWQQYFINHPTNVPPAIVNQLKMMQLQKNASNFNVAGIVIPASLRGG